MDFTQWDPATKRLFIGGAAGGISGIVTKTVCAPLERVKILHQIQGMHPDQPTKYRSIVQTMQVVTMEEGFVQLWKGNLANVLRVVPTYALKFAFNDHIRDLVKKPGQQNKDLSFYQLMGVGTLAGLLQITITYPLDMVRTRMALSQDLALGVRYKGMLECGVSVVRTEGVAALYKGIGPTWLSGSPYVGLQMSLYEICKRFCPQLPGNEGKVSPFWAMTAGAVAGVLAQTITYPGDTIRKRMQSNGIGGKPRVYTTSWDACVKTWRHEGARGFFKGCWANTVRALPGASVQFVVYDLSKDFITQMLFDKPKFPVVN